MKEREEAGQGAAPGRPSSTEGTLGRISLKQVSVSRPDPTRPSASQNPMNLLVPYLDLFDRLGDEDLARLAQVPAPVVAQLRAQADQICRALARYVDLLPRLGDAELTRLTGASVKTIRFWRMCQPRAGAPPASGPRATAPVPVRPNKAEEVADELAFELTDEDFL